MAGTEKGQNVLLQVGDGGDVSVTGIVYSITTPSAANTIERSSGSFLSGAVFVAGMAVHITGFDGQGVNTTEIHAILAAVDANSLFLESIVDQDGNPLTLLDEAAGDNVTIVGEVFNTIRGQDDTQEQTAASSIDASTKDTGKWGASLSGTNRQTVTANGKVSWPDTNGLTRILDELEDQGEVWLKLILNLAGDYYWGKYSITQKNLGGAKDGATTYQLSFENKLRPNLVRA